MKNQNRNNRAHTEGQSGKTDWIKVLQLIHGI